MNLFIDIGSSNIKYATADYDEIKSVKSVKFPTPSVDDGTLFEVPAYDIITIIKKIISNNKNIENIFFSTQMHGYVLLDKNFNELTEYISWRDKRSTLVNANVAMKAENGVNMKANLPKASIIYFKEKKPEIYKKINHFMTLGSYISYKLTGNNSSHITDLSPSGFYNIVDRSVDEMFFNLPKPCYDVEVVGKYKGINVYSPVGDQQASIYGIPYEEKYVLNLGTASQICEVSDEFVSGKYETRPFFNNQYLLTITGLPGASLIKSGFDRAELKKIYHDSLMSLPKKEEILATGGVLNVMADYFSSLLEEFNLKYSLNAGIDSLNGLFKLSKEAK